MNAPTRGIYTPEELAAERERGEDRDRMIIRILTKPENVGDEDFGPVVIMHQPQAGTLLDGDIYAHVFGPYMSIRDAIHEIETLSAQSGDHCYKVIMPFIPQGQATLVRMSDLIEGLGIEVPDIEPEDDGNKPPLVN